METKGVTCKIPLDLHNQISEEIRETESTMSKFIEMIIREHYEKGANRIMEKGRTLAFQVSEELFQRVKDYFRTVRCGTTDRLRWYLHPGRRADGNNRH